MSKTEFGFRRYHYRNRDVYRNLVEFFTARKRAGNPRVGIAWYWESMRWNPRSTRQVDEGDYKMSNTYRAWYTRLIELNEPELQGFITKSASAADHADLSDIEVQ
jgi:hypothetical protein